MISLILSFNLSFNFFLFYNKLAAILPVVQKQHQLLVTLLLCNAASMEVIFFFNWDYSILCFIVISLLCSCLILITHAAIIYDWHRG